MLGKKILQMTPPSIQKFDLEDTGKLIATVAVSEIDKRVSHRTENPTRTHQCLKWLDCSVDQKSFGQCSGFH